MQFWLRLCSPPPPPRFTQMDPWWNPSVEDQACNRVHRLGQTKPVLIKRFITEDTVEETMLALQERKRSMADAALASNGKFGDANKLTFEDLKMFFHRSLHRP